VTLRFTTVLNTGHLGCGSGDIAVRAVLRRGSFRVTGSSMVKEQGIFFILSRIWQMQDLVSNSA
jgi:hypothetical protein